MSRDLEVIRNQGAPITRKARPVEMGELFREGMKFGAVRIYTHDSGVFSVTIERALGASTVKTGFKTFSTPERALLHALEEAELWGLPELPVRI